MVIILNTERCYFVQVEVTYKGQSDRLQQGEVFITDPGSKHTAIGLLLCVAVHFSSWLKILYYHASQTLSPLRQ